MMKTRTMLLTVALVAVLVLMAGAAGALAGPSPDAPVDGGINYQGRLTNPDGDPLHGTFQMRFQIYDDAGAGTMLWDSGVVSVGVDHGLFNVKLAVEPVDFNGRALWLRIYVGGEWLWPRQELLPVPYALSLRPGAEIAGDSAVNWILKVSNSHPSATGSAIWGSSVTGASVYGRSISGYGVIGYSDDTVGVVGHSTDSWGGYFTSIQGYGIRVITNGSDHWDHGGWFTANYGYGVYAQSTGNYGVVGEGAMAGVRGVGTYWGVSGRSTDGIGVSGSSLNYNGVSGSSDNYHGVEGMTWRGDDNYGLFTQDNLYSLNFHTMGATMQVAQNGGDAPLEPGDVVVLSGMTALPEADAPAVIQVTRASSANSPAVAGVVYSRFAIETAFENREPGSEGSMANREITPEGPVPPGEYLLLVVRGPAQVKASALPGAIQPGDLLSNAGEAGYAARAPWLNLDGVQFVAPGTVLGKALEPLDAGRGSIYILVTLQ